MLRPWCSFLILLLTCLLARQSLAAPAKQGEMIVPLVTYYNYAPFYAPGDPSDLNRELAAYLTRHSGGRYRFEATMLPRGRIDALIQVGHWEGLLAWANPKFFDEPIRAQFTSSRPLMLEKDLVVSRADAPVRFTGLASLRGKRLGTVINHYYADVEKLFETGEVQRSDAGSQEANLRKLIAGRVDVTFVSRSSLNHWRLAMPDLDGNIFVAEQARDQFTRHVMMTRGLPPDLVNYVKATVVRLESDPAWHRLLVRYQLNDQKTAMLVRARLKARTV